MSRTQSEVPSGFKIAYDPEDDSLHLQERIQNRFRFNYPRYIERHRKLEIDEGVILRVRDSEEFVAWFQHADLGSGDKQVIHRRIKLNGMRFDPILYDLPFFTWQGEVAQMRSADPEDFTVLVESVKFVEEPQRVIPSLVWLPSRDVFYGILPHALYAFLQKGLRVFNQGVANGETGMSCRTPSVGNDQLPSQMVETAPEVVQSIANVSDNLSGIGRAAPVVIDVLQRLYIFFGVDYIWVGIEECFECPIQLFDVIAGPICFE